MKGDEQGMNSKLLGRNSTDYYSTRKRFTSTKQIMFLSVIFLILVLLVMMPSFCMANDEKKKQVRTQPVRGDASNKGPMLDTTAAAKVIKVMDNKVAVTADDDHSVVAKAASQEFKLQLGEFVTSPNQQYRFGLQQDDGNLVLLDTNHTSSSAADDDYDKTVVWQAKTFHQGVTHAKLQSDGNFVVSSQGPVWATGTSNYHDAKENGVVGLSLQVSDNGVVTLYCPIRGHVWSHIVDATSLHHASHHHGRIDTTTLTHKVMAGYQGWFFAKGDGSGRNKWVHWSKHSKLQPDADTINIDFWPDLSELDDDELYPTALKYQDGSNAAVYSAYNRKTVERHCRWMLDYGIDGVFVQRFIEPAMAHTEAVDTVLSNVRSGAEKFGRAFVVMYDISGGKDSTTVQDIIQDWKHLVDNQHITKSRQYLHHKGRPLLAIWGFGFRDRHQSPEQAATLINWFKYEAPDKYKVTLMGGVPQGWRQLERDSQSDPEWAQIYRQYDVISPWSVGRYTKLKSADKHKQTYIMPDIDECNTLGIDYMPVVFPGFSFHNHNPNKPLNEIPRNGGTFLWRQMYNAIHAGSQMVYVAMFDEVDEGTAIFKLAENVSQLPTEGKLVALDADNGYKNIPSDWYLQIVGNATKFVRQGQELPEQQQPALDTITSY